MGELRSRRSVLAVPGSNPRFIEKARGLDTDAFFLDLEDAVAPLEKEDARGTVVRALNAGGWDGRVRTVRMNDITTEWAYRDVITIVEGAGTELDALVLPKVTSAHDVQWLDTLLTQIERVGLLRKPDVARGNWVDVNARLRWAAKRLDSRTAQNMPNGARWKIAY